MTVMRPSQVKVMPPMAPGSGRLFYTGLHTCLADAEDSTIGSDQVTIDCKAGVSRDGRL